MIRASFYLLIALTMVIVSCQSSYDFWEVSKFRMDSLALIDNEPIKLLYTSRGPDNNKELSYYIHVVAISQKSGDTVNILTTANNGFKEQDGDKIYNFFDQNNLVTKMTQSDNSNLTEPGKMEELRKSSLKKINKVARDPKFDYIADNNYPTVIGSIGIVKTPE